MKAIKTYVRMSNAPIAVSTLLVVFSAINAHAQPAVGAEYGADVHGDYNHLDVSTSIPTTLGGRIGSAALNVSLNANVSEWHATRHRDGHSDLTDYGLAPQLRFLLPNAERVQPYVDLGLGVHVLSAQDLGERHLGSRFLLGEYVGMGARFGEHHRLAASLRLSHESNGGTHPSNSGLTTFGLRFEYTLP